ncbi:MAG: hypothetical protein IPL09_08335 [Bacteroidetes bacterium]|nr:hypothetical protein [Bacteroidota bacterium]
MKFLGILIVILTIQIKSYSQKVNVNEPEWTNEILFVNLEENKTEELERQEYFTNAKVGAGAQITGIGSAKTRIKVNGGLSTSRFKPSDGKLYFLYRTENNTQNPKDLVHLYAFETEGKFRTIITGKANSTNVTAGKLSSLNYKAEKYKSSSYLIIIENLPQGQYGFSLGKEVNKTVHMFAVPGGKEDIPEKGKLPLFPDFFELRKNGELISNSTIQITKDPSSDDYNSEICELLKNKGITCVDEKGHPDYKLEYYYGTYLRRGPEGKCLQIRIVSLKNDSEVLICSKNIASFPPPSKKIF